MEHDIPCFGSLNWSLRWLHLCFLNYHRCNHRFRLFGDWWCVLDDFRSLVVLVGVFFVSDPADAENFLNHALDLCALDVLRVQEVPVHFKQLVSH